jgi:hypothetical protein
MVMLRKYKSRYFCASAQDPCSVITIRETANWKAYFCLLQKGSGFRYVTSVLNVYSPYKEEI